MDLGTNVLLYLKQLIELVLSAKEKRKQTVVQG